MNQHNFFISKITQNCQSNRCTQTAVFEIKEKWMGYQNREEEKIGWYCKKHFEKKILELGWVK